MKYNISLVWYLFDGRSDPGVTVSPTLGNFVPKFTSEETCESLKYEVWKDRTTPVRVLNF